METNPKTTIMVSIIGVALFIVAVFSASYAYYTANVTEKNSNTSSSDFDTAHLSIKFTDGAVLKVDKMVPGDKNQKEITVENEGNVPISFKINVKDVTNDFSKKADVVYTIKEKGGSSPIKSETQFPDSATTLSDKITLAAGVSKTYVIEIEYKNTSDDQTTDMGKTIKGKIFIEEVTK